MEGQGQSSEMASEQNDTNNIGEVEIEEVNSDMESESSDKENKEQVKAGVRKRRRIIIEAESELGSDSDNGDKDNGNEKEEEESQPGHESESESDSEEKEKDRSKFVMPIHRGTLYHDEQVGPCPLCGGELMWYIISKEAEMLSCVNPVCLYPVGGTKEYEVRPLNHGKVAIVEEVPPQVSSGDSDPIRSIMPTSALSLSQEFGSPSSSVMPYPGSGRSASSLSSASDATQEMGFELERYIPPSPSGSTSSSQGQQDINRLIRSYLQNPLRTMLQAPPPIDRDGLEFIMGRIRDADQEAVGGIDE